MSSRIALFSNFELTKIAFLVIFVKTCDCRDIKIHRKFVMKGTNIKLSDLIRETFSYRQLIVLVLCMKKYTSYKFISKSYIFWQFWPLNIKIVKVINDFYMLISLKMILDAFPSFCMYTTNLCYSIIFRSRKWHFL